MAPYLIHILIPDNTSPETACDIARSESALEIIQTLGNKGWAVLRNSTAVSSASKEQDVVSNTAVKTLFGALPYDGEYQHSTVNIVKRTSAKSEWIRAPKWELFAEGQGTSAIWCHHLGGTPEDKWIMKYDKAGRSPESGEEGVVELRGTDIVLVAAYLRFSVPAPTPEKELYMAVMLYAWKNHRSAELSSGTS
ncbi:uncharacterized protein PV07_04735 [Cladophialophora immunda]|uniref:Uncharacterized protein n=1 Tax=Cladophialophora immunda TaxID=569365 RepID=A0A0D2CF60_9EURO|nr:uncharacterized protein PV07_04735 [Cladophialophora immunda]KIW28880.1 hypothetical protein PV07_04735 [Cladophialophora immunda]